MYSDGEALWNCHAIAWTIHSIDGLQNDEGYISNFEESDAVEDTSRNKRLLCSKSEERKSKVQAEKKIHWASRRSYYYWSTDPWLLAYGAIILQAFYRRYATL